jgi:hypothetical protein
VAARIYLEDLGIFGLGNVGCTGGEIEAHALEVVFVDHILQSQDATHQSLALAFGNGGTCPHMRCALGAQRGGRNDANDGERSSLNLWRVQSAEGWAATKHIGARVP